MPTGLFSTYRQGENRVTSTFLAILERLSLSNIDRILQTLLEDSDFRLINFQNQPIGEKSIPDGRIQPSTPIWLETKTARGAANLVQIKSHLGVVDSGCRLLLLTPDDNEPEFLNTFEKCDKDKVVWSNFRKLSDGIESILQDAVDPPTERESFLLREFVALLKQDGLLDSREDTVLVVAARHAWPEYQEIDAYICQQGRSFRPADYLAFYADGNIQPLIPRIVAVQDDLKLTEDMHQEVGTKLKDAAMNLYGQISTKRPHRIGDLSQIFFLSPRDSEETLELSAPVRNDLGHAFTQGQTYVSLKALKCSPVTTSELLEISGGRLAR